MNPTKALVALLFVLTAGDVRADDAEEIRRLGREICVATWTGDAVWFERNLADEYRHITPSGAVKTKQDVIRELSTPGLKMDPYEPFEIEVRVYGETAIMTGRMLQRFTLGRVRYANDLRFTDVYVRRKGRWLLVSGHTSVVAARR